MNREGKLEDSGQAQNTFLVMLSDFSPENRTFRIELEVHTRLPVSKLSCAPCQMNAKVVAPALNDEKTKLFLLVSKLKEQHAISIPENKCFPQPLCC